MDTTHTLAFLAIGALLGAAGQGIRVVVGMKKQTDHARRSNPPQDVADWFDGRKLGLSFILGAVAGVIAAVTQYTVDLTVTRDHLLAFIVAGYAGADFIGGLLRSWLPS